MTNPSTRATGVFVSDTLLFGETASVYGFNRLSRSLKAVMNSFIGLSVVAYFDDFPQIEPQEIYEASRFALMASMRLLGWTMATEEKKNRKFEKVFEVLGVVLDLTKCGEGKLVVAPKKDRLAQIVNMVLKCLADGELSPSEASVLAGRITFLQSSVGGRTASVAMNEVRGRDWQGQH